MHAAHASTARVPAGAARLGRRPGRGQRAAAVARRRAPPQPAADRRRRAAGAADARAHAASPPSARREFADRLAPTASSLPPTARTARRSPSSTRRASTSRCGSTATGLTPAGQAVVAEIGQADDWGLEAVRLPAAGPAAPAPSCRASERADAEIALSLAVLKYARHARGGRAEPTSLSRNIDRKPPLLDPRSVIEEAAKADEPDAYLRGLHPQHPQFERLRQKYLALKRGQPVAQPAQSTGAPQTRASEGARKRAGKRRACASCSSTWSSGAGCRTSSATIYVWVNVPEFMLRVVKNGKVIHTERVIVGKTDTQTPMFSDEMEQVIFHPFWGVPELHQAERDPAEPGARQHQHARAAQSAHPVRRPRHRSRVGRLGQRRHAQVPRLPAAGRRATCWAWSSSASPTSTTSTCTTRRSKNLFNATVRAFSHGCMRVREPQRLAELLLAEDKGWPAEPRRRRRSAAGRRTTRST